MPDPARREDVARATSVTPVRRTARSIRRTMVGWTGLLLIAVIASFGTLLHRRAGDAIIAGVDSSLEDRAQAIAAALEWEEGDGWELDLSEDYLRGLAESSWFEVRDPDGALLRSGGVPPGPASAGSPSVVTTSSDAREHRELTLEGPRGTTVRIGRSIARERAEARALLLRVLGVGSLILVVALAGGWWLASRALRPIAAISRTAENLSERDLSGRIDLRSVPAELRDLAVTLNDAFSRLEEAFERQVRFAADASHELRTPVAVVRAQAESALRRPRPPQELRGALSECLAAAERMTGIVDGLLALARLAPGEESIERRSVELDELVGEEIERARQEAETAGVSLRAALSEVRVPGDARLLAEVVANLVSNAIRYNRRGGTVVVGLSAEDETATITVEDDGLGIPDAALPHLFERFYRVDPARSRERGGSGLGLSIARAIVLAHGGSISAESREGWGSRFTVTLPAWAHPESSRGAGPISGNPH